MKNLRKKAYLALLITALVWGVAPPIIKYTLQFIDPIGFLFYRFELASIIIFIPLVLILRKAKLTARETYITILMGLLGTTIALLLLFTGLTKTTAIEGSLIWTLSPILIITGGVWWLKEKISQREVVGISLTLTGLIFTIIQPMMAVKDSLMTGIEGNLLVLAGTICWAAYSLLLKKIDTKRITPFILTSVSFVLTSLVLLPIMVNNAQGLDIRALPGIIYMAIFGSIVAYLFYTYGVSKIEASEASIFTHLQPVFAIPVAMIFLNETITLPFLFGAALIGIGVYISETRSKKVCN